MERGHPVRQRAKPAQVYAKYCSAGWFARALKRTECPRSGGLQTRAHLWATEYFAPKGVGPSSVDCVYKHFAATRLIRNEESSKAIVRVALPGSVQRPLVEGN